MRSYSREYQKFIISERFEGKQKEKIQPSQILRLVTYEVVNDFFRPLYHSNNEAFVDCTLTRAGLPPINCIVDHIRL